MSNQSTPSILSSKDREFTQSPTNKSDLAFEQTPEEEGEWLNDPYEALNFVHHQVATDFTGFEDT